MGEPRAEEAPRNVALTGLIRISTFLALLEARILFALIRSGADNAGFPHERTVLPAIDRVIGFGELPGTRMQGWFFSGHLTAFDQFWLGIYASWFIVPTVMTAYIVAFRWDLIRSYAALRLAVYFLPLPIYVFMPADPPWMLAHSVRIASLVQNGVPMDGNLSAAFPSMHVLTPAAIAVWLWWKRLDVLGAVFTAYTAVTVFAVLYLGEHYAIDVIASLVLAPLFVMLVARFERRPSAQVAPVPAEAVDEPEEAVVIDLRPALPEAA